MTPTREEVERLLAGATQGKRVQFHGSYCKEAEGTPFTDWDTSHEMSVIRPDGSRYRLAHYKHAADAYLSQMAPDLARALLSTMAKLDEAEAERDRLAAANAQLEARVAGLGEALGKAQRALKPFAARVFDDNGDFTISDTHTPTPPAYWNAKNAERVARAALAAHGKEPT